MSLPENSKIDTMQKIRNLLTLSNFGYLNCTQFLGAMNDNIFKLLIVYCFISLEGQVSSNTILASVGAIYVIPFLLLSSTAGTMADRYSKRTIIIGVKIVESLVMGLGMLAFYLESKPLAYSALFLLACHSTIFAPCKYGIVPEIVPQERISKANGLLTFCTYGAIIIGTFLASFITDITNRNFIIASACTLVFALVGLYSGYHIPKTAPSGSKKEISPRFLTELFKNLKIIYSHPSLLSAVLGSAFFLFVGSYAQLNMIPFALHSLGLSDVQGGYLFLLSALGIGAGSILAGKLSGERVELGLVPIGGAGLAIVSILIGLSTNYLLLEIALIILFGVFGGLYIVPLDSYIQIASPNTIRGQVIATTNFLGFFGVLCSAGILYLLSEILGLDPSSGFFVIGIVSFIFVLSISIAISGYFVRYLCMLFTRYYAKARIASDSIENNPALYFSTLPAYPWSLFLTSIQPKRLCTFMVTSSTLNKPWYKNLFSRLCSRYEIATVDDLHPEKKMGKLLICSLQRGTSIAIFASSPCEIESYSSLWQTAYGKEISCFSFTKAEVTDSNYRYEASITALS
jgi:acyl-[acyl-carrier-protein]-phospholipid O-acyltransferase/long-chain-fatty-acid--[acyl-carrier-protein] ligase